MGFNVKSLYGGTANTSGTATKGFNVQSLKNREFEVRPDENTYLGNISYGAKMALDNGTIDTYKPINDSEKSTLDAYKKWVEEQETEADNQALLSEMTDDEKSVLAKYGYDPLSFNNEDFKDWAETHNFEYRMAGNDLTGAEMKWLPKQKGGWKFWETLTTDEEEADKKVLERFVEKKNIRANATNHPVFTSAITVVTAPIRGIAGAVATTKNAVESAFGKEVTTNDTAHNIVEDSDLIRDTVTDEHASKWFGGASGKLGNYGALTYNGLMSIGDTVAISLTTKGIGSGLGLTGKGLAAFTSNATSGLLSSTSGASTIMQKKKEGLSDGKAVANGLASAAAEFVTEKVSLDLIFKRPTSMLRKGLISFLAEGTEEATSDVLTKTADYFISGDDSTIRKNINKYVGYGLSKKDATKQAVTDSFYETLSAALVGGFSGVAISGAYHGFGTSELKKLGADYREVAADIIQSGLDAPTNSNAHKYAKKISAKGIDNITDYELGLLHTYNVEQIEYEEAQEAKKNKKNTNTQAIQNEAVNSDETTHEYKPQTSETTLTPTPSNTPATTQGKTSIEVGDVFKGTTTGNTVRIIDRNEDTTTVAMQTADGEIQKNYSNSAVDALLSNSNYEFVGNNTSVNTETQTDTDSPSVVSEPKNITLTQMGDFYEAFGDDAVELAEKLNLQLTSKTINGQKVQMVGFPVHVFDKYKSALGSNYNLTVSSTPTVTSINSENMHVTDAETAENADVTNTDVDYEHSYNEDTAPAEFLNSVNKEIETAIVNIRNGNLDAVPDTIEVTKLSKEAIEKISAFVGFDISGYSCKIEKDRLVHIENRHGINGEHDHSLADPKDTARMGYVVNNSDNIEWVVDENGNRVYDRKYNNKDNTVAPVMSLSSRIDGTYCVSQVVPDSKKKTLWIASARIEKAAVGSQVPNDNNVIPQPTSETPLNSSSASTDIISENTENVNTQTDESSSTTENAENSAVESENAPTTTTDTNSDLNLSEGEILSLKHTKNMYSVFKGCEKMIKSADLITDGYCAFPYNGQALAAVQKIFKGKITDSDNLSMSRLYHKENDVIIQGNPKIDERNGLKTYIFMINDTPHICQQKYIDAFNKKGYVIKATAKDTRIPWTVHDADGNFVALFLGVMPGKAADYDKLQTVNDVLSAEKSAKEQKKVEIAEKQSKGITPDANVVMYGSDNNKAVTHKTDLIHIKDNFYRSDDAFVVYFKDIDVGLELEGISNDEYFMNKDIERHLNKYDIAGVFDSADSFADYIAKNIENKPAFFKNTWIKFIETVNPDVAEKMRQSKAEYLKNRDKAENNVAETTVETVAETTETDTTDTSEKNAETVSELTDKCTLTATKHTATDEDIWVVSLNDKLSKEQYNELKSIVKTVGGYYSRFAKTPDGKALPGFVFKTEPTADVINAFNNFFATDTTTTEATETAEPVKENIEKPAETEKATEITVDGITMKVGDTFPVVNDETTNFHSAFGGSDWVITEIDAERGKVQIEHGTDNAVVPHEGKNLFATDLARDIQKMNTVLETALKNEPESDTIKENANKRGVNNVESQQEVLAGESTADDRGLQSRTSGTSDESGTETDSRPHRNNGGDVLQQSDGTASGRPTVGNDGKRTDGSNDADNGRTESTGDTRGLDSTEPETVETQDKIPEKKKSSNKGNFVITDDVATELDTTAPSAKDNIEAIELLLTLENEGRAATTEEKKILAKYKGWGGIDTRYIPYELSSRFGKLFDWEQRKAMQSSQNNAFFTPTKVIDAMYNGLKRMGFKGGNILETSMGIGNFFGRMPSAISSKSALTGVELESYTARIAQYLYPGATVINKPFQDVAIKNGSYDLVIGNVPFGTNKLTYNKKKYNLHNYFIVSSLDKVRDGGIVAVITSSGTLDSYSLDARKAIMDRADIVACYKLPEKVFSRNADTDVQTDLLILRKRANDEKPKGDSILNVITTKDGLRINEYFDKHPENVLGTLAKGTNAWGEITTVLNTGDFYDRLDKAMKKLPKDIISGKTELKPIETIVSISGKPRFYEQYGKVYVTDGTGTAEQVTKREQTVRDYMAVRDAYKTLLSAYENGETIINANGTMTIKELSDEEIKPLRDALSKAYDNFYKKHTAITGDGKKKIGQKKCTDNRFLEADADYYLVSGLEQYDAKNSKFVKSALFEKDTLRKKKVTSVDVASDALAVSLNESGKIDFARMSELTGKTEKQLAEELKGEIVYTPDGEYVLTDIYLSGNIYEKLEAVKGKAEFKEQEEMLKSVLPTPKDASSITVKLGANFIDTSYIKQFAREVLSSHINIAKDSSGRWVIDGVRQSRYGDIVNVKYGCGAFNAVQLLEKILNDTEITATKTEKQGDKSITVFDAKMTDIARQKAEDIKTAFENWLFKDSDRRAAIVDKYNRTYNNYRPLDYEHIAEKLSFDSMDSTLKAKLYPHQKKGIARFLFGGNILFAHGVGTGKTFEMIASVMEAKRMGIINKAAMVVPNNKLVDFKHDIAQAYPNAKVLVIETANKKRQTMLGLVNSNDWDIVLIARTTFTKIPVSDDLQINYIAQQLEDLEVQIAEAESNRDISRRQLKGLYTQRDNLEQKMKDLNSDTKRDENSVDFEKLGIDCICIDEAHNYKSILTPTKLDIKGLVNRNNAQMANDMLMKLDYMRSIDGKIIFGTGTPITNTVSEIYNMMRMVRPDILDDAGIHSLDEWVNTFAKIDSVTEIGIDNKIKSKSTQVIRSFVNASEMMGMFRQFADIVFTEDVVKNLPKAKYVEIELEGTSEHRQIEAQITEVLTKTPPSERFMKSGPLMAMASAAAIDLKLLSGADSEYNIFKDFTVDELEYSDSKTNVMCNNVYDEYKASADIKGTQIIFCDGGAGSGKLYSFNVHKDIKNKLIERGIPSDEIVIVKSQNDAQLEELYEKVNNGDVRVLIGTSSKMAEGLNVQKRVVAIHHPTVTYKPSDWEQGNARGVRAGNINDEVRIYRYLQKNTFDSHKWQAQDRKGEMIRKALKGEQIAEMEDIGADDDGGAGIDAATAMAITSGNPLVKEKIDIDKEVVRLKNLKQNYLQEKYRYEDAIAKNPNYIRQATAYLENLEQDIALRDKFKDKTAISIKGKSYAKQTEANKALNDAVKNAPKNGQFSKLGTYNGFDIMFKGDTGGMGYTLVLKGANEYGIEYAGNGNHIAKFAGVLNRLDAEKAKRVERIARLKEDLDFAKKEVTKPFEKESDLTEALEKQKDITYRYEHYNENTQKQQSDDAEIDSAETVRSSKDINNTDNASDRWTTDRIDNSKKKSETTVNIAEIVKSISDKFGIPIATGKVTDREASGIYKEKPETIRTRIANNLPTISHELGHHLDKQYGLSKLDSVKELRKAIPKEFLDNYSADEKNGEAVAEFVRTYLRNKNDADRMCPDFYADFIKTLSKEDLKALNEVASAVNEYLSYNISERYDAAIVSSKKSEKLSFKDKWHKLYSDWVDAFHAQKEAVDYVENVTGQSLSGKGNAYVLATNSLNAHTIANYLICDGFRDLDGNMVDAKSFVDSIGMIDSKNVKLLDKYLVLRHSLEWIAPQHEDVTAKRVFADDTLENVEEIKKQIAEIEKEHPEIKTAAENLYEYQNNVIKHFVIPAGGMTTDTLATLNQKYPSYVPFYRAVGKQSGMAKGTFANQRSPIMRAKGSGALIISPVESIIRNTEKMVKFALRNQVMQTWANYADNVEGFGQFMEKVAPDMLPHFTDITQQKEQFADALQNVVSSGEDYFAVSDLFDEMFGNAVADFTPIANANKKIVTVLKNGTPSYYQIHDNAFYNSVAELSTFQLESAAKWSNMIMQPMKMLTTQNNPIFAGTNAIRDFGTAYKLSDINNPISFAIKYALSLKGILSNSKDYRQYKAMGGGHSSELTASIDNISKTLRRVAQKDMGKARRLASALFIHPVETVAQFNDLIESTPRFMEFQRTLESDGDLQKAIYNANDLTTNFSRKGASRAAKEANAFIMYNNAAIQGLDKMARTFKDPKKRYKTLLKWGLNALIMAALQHFWNDEVDKEGWRNLSAYKKNNFYNFAVGDGQFISLPKPRENGILDSFTERTIEYVFGNDEAFYDFGGYVATNIIPPMLEAVPDLAKGKFLDAGHSFLDNTVLGGIADVGWNEDFKGTPIESDYDKYNPSNERYSESTTKLAYALGQTDFARNRDLSPKQIDHLISSYTGVLGQVNKALFPMNEERRDVTIGLRNKFISDSNYSTDVLNKMYENEEKAEKAFMYDGTIDSAVEYEQNAIITGYISGMDKAVKALPKDEQRNGRAYLLKSLNRWNYDNTASQTEMLSRLDGETVSDDCIVTSVPKSNMEWTVTATNEYGGTIKGADGKALKIKCTYQMTPQEYDEYIKDYLTLLEKYRSYQAKTISDTTAYTQALAEADTEVKKVLKKKYQQKYYSKAEKVKK